MGEPSFLSLKHSVCGLQDVVRYGHVSEDDTFAGLSYKALQCDPAIKDHLDDRFARVLRNGSPQYMMANADILPHVDSGIKTAINIYISAGGYTTSYHKPKAGAKPFRLANQTNGGCYNFEDVETLDSFTAVDGDVYVLDVSRLHSVQGGQRNLREVITIGLSISFEKVTSKLLAPLL